MNSRVVLMTFPSKDKAQNVVKTLLEERLIACGNILPKVTSLYWWEGKIEESEEVLVIAKTSATNLEKLEVRFTELHPYDTPEFLSIEPNMISKRYADWIEDSLRTK